MLCKLENIFVMIFVILTQVDTNMRFIQNKVVAHPLDDGEVIENPTALKSAEIASPSNNNTQNEINSTSINTQQQQQQQLSSTPTKQTQQQPDASTIIQNPATTTAGNNNNAQQQENSSSTTKQTPGNKALEGVNREAFEKGGEPLTQVHTKKTKCCICCSVM